MLYASGWQIATSNAEPPATPKPLLVSAAMSPAVRVPCHELGEGVRLVRRRLPYRAHFVDHGSDPG